MNGQTNGLTVAPVIPARRNSKGIAHKNRQVVGGIPLVEHAILFAKENICTPIVSTDDEWIIERYKDEVHLVERLPSLTGDDVPMVDVLRDVLHYTKAEVLCVLQPTNPFRDAELYQHCIDRLMGDVQSVFTAIDVGEWHPGRMYYASGQKYEPREDNPNRQDLPQVVLRDGAIYLFRRECIKQGRLFGHKWSIVVRGRGDSWNIDEPFDLLGAQWLHEHHSRDRQRA